MDAFLAEVALVEEEVFSRRMQTIRRDEQRRARDQGMREAARKRHGGALHQPDQVRGQKATQPRVEARVVPISELRGSKRQRISTTETKEVKKEAATGEAAGPEPGDVSRLVKAEPGEAVPVKSESSPAAGGKKHRSVKPEEGAGEPGAATAGTAVKGEQPAGEEEDDDDDDDDDNPGDTAGLEMKASPPVEVRAPTRAEEARYQQAFRTKKRQWERDDTVQDHIRLGDKGYVCGAKGAPGQPGPPMGPEKWRGRWQY